MKNCKLLSLLLVILMILSFTACSKQNEATPEAAEEVTAPSVSETEPEATEAETDKLNWAPSRTYNLDEESKVKNIILLIGDGMGENIILNSEIVKGSPLSMQNMPYSCYVGTDSLDGTTDSAAASTALSCGVKTKNQYIGVDENAESVETIIEFCKAKNMKAGLVATHLIPHATPAGMVAHANYRGLYNVILRHMIGANVEVLLGGGTEYTETKKMETRIKDAGYTYVKTSEELQAVKDAEKLMGAFSYADMNADWNPSLTTMASKALELLEGDDGFFLMVEASHVDIYEANMDMNGTINEMQAFDKCIDYVLSWAEEHPGTLVIVTADHETGGVILPESGKAEDVTDTLFTSEGEHTSTDVKLFAAGAQAGKLFTEEKIENTDVAKIMRKALNESYGENEVVLLNQ